MFPIVRVLLVFLCIFGFGLSFTSDELRVTLSNGSKLVGRYLRSFSGRPIKAFTNIPYAKPPVGPLRFKAPEPVDKWDGEYEAIDDGPVCPQRNIVSLTAPIVDTGTEDCLRLNVYVPYSFDERLSNLTVMVFMFGGAFTFGSGSRSEYGPDYILDEDIILVSGNCRVGALGFLSTEDENCPGNFAFKDQVLVLKWVQENIQQFGGDPNSVTIYGESSGGAVVTYLMTSPLAEGLFSKAIAQSGSDLASWALPQPKNLVQRKARRLAERFDCYTENDWAETIECLRLVPALNISASISDFYEFHQDPRIFFKPVIEPNLPGAFLTEHSREVIAERSLKIPFLVGNNHDEGVMKSADYFNNPKSYEQLIKNWAKALPAIFYYDHFNLTVQQMITEKITEFYFRNNITMEKQQNLTNLFGDEWYFSPVESYLRLRLAHKHAAPTYMNLLCNKGSVSYTTFFLGDINTYHGVSHGDDLIYLFPIRETEAPTVLPTKDEDRTRRAMIQMWVNFARTGNPTPEQSQLPKWNPANGFPVNFYRIGNFHFEDRPMFGMETGGFFEDRNQFWRGIHSYLSANEEK